MPLLMVVISATPLDFIVTMQHHHCYCYCNHFVVVFFLFHLLFLLPPFYSRCYYFCIFHSFIVFVCFVDLHAIVVVLLLLLLLLCATYSAQRWLAGSPDRLAVRMALALVASFSLRLLLLLFVFLLFS